MTTRQATAVGPNYKAYGGRLGTSIKKGHQGQFKKMIANYTLNVLFESKVSHCALSKNVATEFGFGDRVARVNLSFT